MTFVWATRGRDWGFRFLSKGGLADPLAVYEQAFDGIGDDAEGIRSLDGCAAVRFTDPLGRVDRSGRPIRHDVVVFGDLAREMTSVDDAVRAIWPLVEDRFAAIWDQPSPHAD